VWQISQASQLPKAQTPRASATPAAFARPPPEGGEVTFANLKRKLSETLGSMREVHTSHLMYKARLEADIAELEESLPHLRIAEAATVDRYSFYAETKAYICNLLVCLDAKVSGQYLRLRLATASRVQCTVPTAGRALSRPLGALNLFKYLLPCTLLGPRN
jgi:hypothetical protein